MKLSAPKYYGSFKCIADKCQNSCCVGWEIDLDPITLDKYSSLSGEAYAFGEAAFELDGVSFYYTAVGVADLPLLEGETYIFRLESWS